MRTNLKKFLAVATLVVPVIAMAGVTSSATSTNDVTVNAAGKLLWSQTFTGAAGTQPSSSTWQAVTGSGTYGTGEIETNTNSTANLYQDGLGNLVIKAICTPTSTPCTSSQQPMGANWTSARIWTMGLRTFKYGQIEARIWMPSGSWNWPAFWMMGENFLHKDTNNLYSWPYCGEIDIAEGLVNNTREQSTIHSNVPGTGADWLGGSGFTQTAPITGAKMTSGYHNYGILWKPNEISYTLDGKIWATDTYNPSTGNIKITQPGKAPLIYGEGSGAQVPVQVGGTWPFNNRFFLILNDAIGGIVSPVAPNGTTSTMKVQWVKYYTYKGYGSTSTTP